MKNIRYQFLTLMVVIGMITNSLANTNIQGETLGDNFSLEGALEMFKASESLEEFEEKINNEDNDINNLDLNEDGEIDYIRVIDNMDEDVHAFVLQALVDEEESQDVAVIEMEKVAAENVILQILGDELLYGENHIVEPFETESKQTGKSGPSMDLEVDFIVVNVWTWRLVKNIYHPNYRVYRSPYKWGNYPKAWRPWKPVTTKVFHPRATRHRVAYRVTPTHRVVRAHKIYTPKRKSSKRVVARKTVHHSSKAKGHSTKKKTTKKKKVKTTKARKTKNSNSRGNKRR